MNIFAKNTVVAKSKFYNSMSKNNKIKKCNTEILSITEPKEEGVLKARTYGVWLTLNSKNNPKKVYKEFRETSRVRTASKCYQVIAALYKLNYFNVDILSMAELTKEEIKRDDSKQFAEDGIRFPVITATEKPIRHGIVSKNSK
eukprot:GHVP01033295.1.p1 GENE.GHVP01033295.1~~GHVP01033295.1.p1  ORF type:complete len:166 (+),score=28.23 GHVP01033295.1:67-498(+)